MTTLAPLAKDVTDFRFVQLRPVQLLGSGQVEDPVLKRSTQLLAIGNTCGFLFAGVKNGVMCTEISQIEGIDLSVERMETRKVPENLPAIKLEMPSTPTHLALNSEDLILSVSVIVKGLPFIYLFDTRAFVAFRANPQNIKPFQQISPSTPPGTYVQELQWNPVTQNLLAVTYSNGSLALFAIPDGANQMDCWTLPPAEGITCISWSPKGKQLVAGRSNGSLTQYKPDLKEAKTIPGPSGKNFSAVSILWVSTYQFLVNYKDNSDPNSRPGFYLVQASKAGPTTFTFFDDICYSTGEDRQSNFNSIQIGEWGVIFVASANSIEVGILGAQDKEQSSWVQWTPPDYGRAEIPLASDQTERYPVGVALSTTTRQNLKQGESLFPHSMPALFMLTSDGLLCGFYAVNQTPLGVQITKAAQPLNTTTQMRQGTIDLPRAIQPPANTVAPTPAIPAIAKTTAEPQMAAPKTTFGFGGGPSAAPSPFMSSTPSKPTAQPVVTKPTAQPVATMPAAQPVVTMPIPKPESISAQKTNPIQSSVHKEAKPAPSFAKGHPGAKPTSGHEEAYGKAINEELLIFSNELKKFKEKASKLNINIGSSNEKVELKQEVERMDRFCKDVIEITNSQAKEFETLKKSNLELCSWVEEAKSRDVRNKNPKYRQLLRNRSLDPASQKKMSALDSKFLYLDQQLQTVNETLDMEWDQHLKKSKSKGIGGMGASPTKEMVYKTILNHRNILESEKAVLSRICKDIKSLKLQSTSSANSPRSQDQSSQIHEISQSFQEKTRISENDQKDQTFSPMKSGVKFSTPPKMSPTIKVFSPEKQSALRNFLVAKGTTKVRPIKSVQLTETQFMKMISPVKSESQETKSRILLDLLAEKEEMEPKPKPVPDYPSSSSASSSKSSSSGSLSSCGVGLTSQALFPGSTSQSTFGARMGASQAEALGVPQKSSSFTGGLAMSSTSTTGSPSPSQAQMTSSTLPKPSFNFGLAATTEVFKQDQKTDSSGTIFMGSSPSPFGSQIGGKGSIFGTPSGSSLGIAEAKTGSANKPAQPFGSGLELGSLTLTTSTSNTKPTTPSNVISSNSGKSAAPPNVSVTSVSSKPVVSTTSTTPVTTPASKESIFGGPQTSSPGGGILGIFGTPTSSTSLGTTTPSSGGSIFGKSATTGTIFGGVSTTNNSGSLFGGGATTTSGASTTISGVSTTTSGESTTTSGASTTTSSGSTTATTGSGSLFGTGSTATTGSGSLFGGGSTTTTTSKGSIFGTGSTATTTSSGSLFGGGSITTTSAGSLFGGGSTSASATSTSENKTLATSTGSAFNTAGTTSGSSVFGSVATAAGKSGTLFGGASPTSPVFGDTTSTTGGSVFAGSSAKPAASGIFGGSSGTTTTGGIFGSPKTSAPGSSLFGSTTATTSGGSLFGGSTTSTTSASIFGGTTTTTTAATVFGGAQTGSLFGKSSAAVGSIFGAAAPTSGAVFGASNPTTTTSASIFSNPGSVFSNTTSAPATSDTSIFGGSKPAAFSQPVFGGSTPATTSSTTNIFGNESGGLFGSGGSSSGGGFFSGLGSVPSSDSSTKNVFGSSASSTFGGSATSAGSLFGGSTSQVTFGAKPSAFGSSSSGASSFSSPGGNVASQGFGLSQQNQNTPAKSSGFGAPPSFGGSPTFGGQAFGTTPVFGGAPALGVGTGLGSGDSSKGSVFGSTLASDAPTFGSVTGPTFGALSQQAPSFGGFGGQSSSGFGSSSPSSGFGSSSPSSGFTSNPSFSSWR